MTDESRSVQIMMDPDSGGLKSYGSGSTTLELCMKIYVYVSTNLRVHVSYTRLDS
jgi:hypothetical protein